MIKRLILTLIVVILPALFTTNCIQVKVQMPDSITISDNLTEPNNYVEYLGRPHQLGEFWEIHSGKVVKFIHYVDAPYSDEVVFADGYTVQGYEVFTNSPQFYTIPNKEELRDYFQMLGIGRSLAIMVQTYPEPWKGE